MDEGFDARQWVADQEWRFAVTVPDHPHFYVVPARTGQPDEGFRAMARWVRRHGYDADYEGRRYRYADLDGWTYWVSRTTITMVNRRHREPGPWEQPQAHVDDAGGLHP